MEGDEHPQILPPTAAGLGESCTGSWWCGEDGGMESDGAGAIPAPGSCIFCLPQDKPVSPSALWAL